jgi:cell division septum initiation protein DivIVA
MRQTLTKADELSALRRLAEQLGPHSYLGPWLQDALPYLSDSLRSDIHPISALQLHQQATADRVLGLMTMQQAQTEARELRDSAREKADVLLQQATADAERITSRAWQAIRLAMKELEA